MLICLEIQISTSRRLLSTAILVFLSRFSVSRCGLRSLSPIEGIGARNTDWHAGFVKLGLGITELALRHTTSLFFKFYEGMDQKPITEKHSARHFWPTLECWEC
jgi:hypothetical protein